MPKRTGFHPPTTILKYFPNSPLPALQNSIDAAAVAPYLGAYHNAALGDMALVTLNNRLFMFTGGFLSELKSAGHDTYVLYDPPLAGFPIALTKDAAGQPIVVFSVTPDTLHTQRDLSGRESGAKQAGSVPASLKRSVIAGEK